MRIFFNFSSRSDKTTREACKRVFNFIDRHYSNTYDCFEKEVTYTQELNNPLLESLYNEALSALQASHIVILEVSTNSFTQGYLLQRALELSKPVIALHRKGSTSIFVKGIKNKLLQIVEYDEKDLEETTKYAISYAADHLQQRFNFYLPSDIATFIKEKSKQNKVSASALVRSIIRTHMSATPQQFSSLN